mgnify:CR=1 FL=1
MSNIYKTSVAPAGLTKLIQRLGRDCTPTQFIREFVMNGIEAILRVGGEGKIIVDVNWTMYNQDSVFRMCFIDTGDGMTPDQMLEHLNNLSSSGHSNNVYENYGVGAKIAALTRNHEGIFYESWVDGHGYGIYLHFDEESDAYGIRSFGTEENSPWCIELSDDVKPEDIDKHGTKVTLFGMETGQDTLNTPAGAEGYGGRENWFSNYLNTRFFDIPKGIELRGRVGYYRGIDNRKQCYLRQLRGQRVTLDKYKISSGNLMLSDAKVYWWILKKDRDSHGREFIKGHTGSLNQGELFDIGSGRSNKAPGFGIILGKENVVIYLEPIGSYVQNTTRTGLIKQDGATLPWDKWQDEFRSKMPEEISAYVKNCMNSIINESNDESIRNRLKAVSEFYKISRYKPLKGGSIIADPDSEIIQTVGAGGKGKTSGGGRRGRPGSGPGSIEELLLSVRKEREGVTAEEVKPTKFPQVTWVSFLDNTRQGDDLEDRAAEFLEKDNIIKANMDFQGFTDLIEYFIKLYPDVDEASNVIKSEVKEAFEQQLIETVTGALSLKNRPKWTPDEFQSALSQEALTAAVMPRYHIVNYVKRAISNKLGKATL